MQETGDHGCPDTRATSDMTPLRNKMIRELELHRKAAGTIKQYVAAVAELAHGDLTTDKLPNRAPS